MITDGWWDNAAVVRSPNYNARPALCDIDLLVIHNISLPPNEYGGGHVQNFFLNQLDPSHHPYFQTIKDLQVSAHALIERDGNTVQFVSFEDRAWHAGKSQFEGREDCNDFSIGIELEGSDEDPYTEAQYCRLVELTRHIMNTYPKITINRIVGHQDIAPGRKSDPGEAFDWERYRSAIIENTG